MKCNQVTDSGQDAYIAWPVKSMAPISPYVLEITIVNMPVSKSTRGAEGVSDKRPGIEEGLGDLGTASPHFGEGGKGGWEPDPAQT
ncbi:hypothetical protein PG994_013728 [Apiospora phragmitis]|uniref:Uncharacterized protein n=1 Tax=Apiospora phragmitis TaxID=2905665 RepID=A0ABR1T9F5_9PEZI